MPKIFGALLLFCCLFTGNIYANDPEITLLLNGNKIKFTDELRITSKDKLLAMPAPGIKWFALKPIQKEYELKTDPLKSILPINIDYVLSGVAGPACSELKLGDGKGIQPGTYFFVPLKRNKIQEMQRLGKIIVSSVEIPQVNANNKTLTVVVRLDDSYLGLLSELNNVPFGLMPKYINGRHQTDLRVLTDCAEFAIYGKRKQGKKIGYVGPVKIVRYLKKMNPSLLYPVEYTEKTVYQESMNKKPYSLTGNGIKPGDIIHFGDQVAVFYEDRGIIGVLDAADLMYYSYNAPPRIKAIGDSEFKDRPLKVYKWKI